LLWSLNTHSAQAFADAGTEIYHLRLAPGGNELAAVGKDGWLRLYRTEDMTLRAALPTGQMESNCVCYSSDGQLAATAGDDGTIRVFDVKSRTMTLKIDAHEDKAFAVVFFDADRKLASCGKDSVIRLWDAATGEPVGTLAGHAGQVEAIDVSPTGDRLVSASSDKTAVLWDLTNQHSRRVLAGHEGAVLAATFSPDGRWMATGSADNTVALWDVRTGRRAISEEQLDEVQSVAFSADGQRLIVGDRSGSVHCYRLTTRNRRLYLRPDPLDPRWQAHASRIWHVAAGATPDSFYTSGKDGFIRRWDDSALARSERTIPAVPGELLVDLDFSPDGRLLLALSESRGITMYDAATLQPERALDCRHSQWQMLRLVGRRHVAAATAYGLVAIWNHETGELCRILSLGEPEHRNDYHNNHISCLAASADGEFLAIASAVLGEARVYETATGRLIGAIPTGAHVTVALSPDGRYLAVDSLDDIALYEVPSLRLQRKFPGHTATIRSIAFSPDGHLLASGSGDRSVRLWTVEGRQLATLTGHLADVSEVQFSPEGRSLVSVDDRGRLHVTHVATRQMLFELPLLADRLHGMSIAPESRRIAMIRTLRDTHEIVIVGEKQ
jgi:WD40 repeat protein